MNATPSYSVGEVGAITGLSPHTSRAWERRHDALQPKRSKSGQRQYSAEDVEFLIHVKQLTRARGLSLKLAVMEARGVLPALDVSMQALDSEAVPVEGASGTWRSVADLLPYLMLLLDVRGRIVDANIPVARAVGRLRRELQGVRFVDLVEPHDRGQGREDLSRAAPAAARLGDQPQDAIVTRPVLLRLLAHPAGRRLAGCVHRARPQSCRPRVLAGGEPGGVEGVTVH